MEAHVAGHSTHFLRRLDRVEEDDVELALTLYRDPELLRAVLKAAQLEGDAPRVAIALRPGDASETPHVVVTRDGAFVTCLAKGMTFEVPRVSFERLQVGVGRVERMREHVAALRELRTEDRALDRFGRRMNSVGPYLAREEMEAALRWYPLVGATLFGVALVLWEHFVASARDLRRVMRNKARDADIDRSSEVMWNAFWAWNHAQVLVHGGTPEQRQHALAQLRAVDSPVASDSRVFMHGSGLRHETITSSLRGVWAVGRNRHLLKSLKQPTTETITELRRALGLTAIGVASQKARREVDDALRKMTNESLAPLTLWSDKPLQELREIAVESDGVREEMSGPLVDTAHKLFSNHAPFLERFPKPEDVPPELVLPIFALRGDDWLLSKPHAQIMLLTLAVAPRAEGPDFYLPASLLDVVRRGLEYGVLGTLLLALRSEIGAIHGETVRHAAPRVGRNDPCPCGSGQKHKRCCARTG